MCVCVRLSFPKPVTIQKQGGVFSVCEDRKKEGGVCVCNIVAAQCTSPGFVRLLVTNIKEREGYIIGDGTQV